MTESPNPPAPMAQLATINADLPCFFCRYNLRSLARDGRCPECGNPVEKSFRHGWLAFADPQWLARLRTGVTIILWLILAAVLGYAALAAYAISQVAASSPAAPPVFRELQAVSMPLWLGFAITWLVSVWFLTTPEPIPQEHTRQSSLAKWIRILTSGQLCSAALCLIAFGITGHSWPQVPTDLQGATTSVSMMVVGTTGSLAGAAGFLLLLIHLRRIARRDIRRGLGKLLTFLIWGSVGLTGLWMASVVYMIFFAATMFGPTATPTMITSTGPAGGTTGVLTALGYATPTPAATTAPAIAPTTQPAGGVQPFAFAGEVQVSPWGVVNVSGSGPATMPATATTMPAGAVAPMPFGGNFVFFMLVACVGELLALAWFVSGIVVLFWLRRAFSKAIKQRAACVPSAGG